MGLHGNSILPSGIPLDFFHATLLKKPQEAQIEIYFPDFSQINRSVFNVIDSKQITKIDFYIACFVGAV